MRQKNQKFKKLRDFVVTDTIDNSKKINNNSKIEVLSISSLMSEAIKGLQIQIRYLIYLINTCFD